MRGTGTTTMREEGGGFSMRGATHICVSKVVCWRGACCVLRWLRVLALAWRVRLGVRFVSGGCARVCHAKAEGGRVITQPPVLLPRKSTLSVAVSHESR